MSLYKNFETDKNLESGEGVVVNYGEGVKFRIHRAGGSNQKFINRQAALVKPFQRQIDNGSLPAEKSRELMTQLYAETIIQDWEGVTDREGNPMPFTKENATKLLRDLPDLYLDLVAVANERATFRLEQQEEAKGN